MIVANRSSTNDVIFLFILFCTHITGKRLCIIRLLILLFSVYKPIDDCHLFGNTLNILTVINAAPDAIL